MLQSGHAEEKVSKCTGDLAYHSICYCGIRACTSFYYESQLTSGEYELDSKIGNVQAQYFRIRFCYDNHLPDCTDSAIDTWNTTHPDDAFYY